MKLLVIAGAGKYPELVVKGAKRAGVGEVDVAAIKGSASRAVMRAADRVKPFAIGQITEGIRWVAAQGYDGAVMAGQVSPLSLFRGGFDSRIREELAAMPVKCAHSIFRRLVEIFDEAGVRMLPASLYMEDSIPGAGPLTVRGLGDAEKSDMARAISVARDMGAHDVGQTVVVKSGMVLAVEAFEGTDAAILRGGKLGGRGAVVFKAAREGHDMRFDIPVMGMKTVKTAKRAGVTAIGFQAGRAIFLDRAEAVEYANRHGIAIVGIDSGLPAAPTRI